MKLLFDQNISFRAVKKIKDIFSGSEHVSDCNLMNCNDAEIWEYAKKYDFAIVTFDSDFYDISLINGHPPKIVWIRAGNLSSNQMVLLLNRNKESINRFLVDIEHVGVSCLEIE
jgi:predicted nuclease of predicted toxin-antitoxin system